jgi:hypothetical protein
MSKLSTVYVQKEISFPWLLYNIGSNYPQKGRIKIINQRYGVLWYIKKKQRIICPTIIDISSIQYYNNRYLYIV